MKPAQLNKTGQGYRQPKPDQPPLPTVPGRTMSLLMLLMPTESIKRRVN